MKILITGIAGFIGYFMAKKCLEKGYDIVGVDNINKYYLPTLKLDRLKQLGIDGSGGTSTKSKRLKFIKVDLADQRAIENIFKNNKFDMVVHLASQAGVRYSINEPRIYVKSNIEGFLNILEGCRYGHIKHFIYASSSSVYGLNQNMPFRSGDPVDHPVSFYAATKRSGELMSHTYSHLYGLPSTGLRFFTVYGPWGRPDMAPFLFIDSVINDREIKIFNYGKMERDFTYVEDIVEAMVRIMPEIPQPERATRPNVSTAPFRIYNIGNSSPVNLLNFVKIIEKFTGKIAKKKNMALPMGDMVKTYADVEDIFQLIDFKPEVSIEDGIKKTVNWYMKYYLK